MESLQVADYKQRQKRWEIHTYDHHGGINRHRLWIVFGQYSQTSLKIRLQETPAAAHIVAGFLLYLHRLQN